MNSEDEMITPVEIRYVVCAPKEEYLAIITTYIPSPEKWENNFVKRRKK